MNYAESPFSTRRPSLWRQVVALALVPTILINSPAILARAQSDTVPPTQAPSTGTYPTPVITPKGVKANRTLPTFTPPSNKVTFSSQPTDHEIVKKALFAEPLVPIGGTTTPVENAALSQALLTFSKRT